MIKIKVQQNYNTYIFLFLIIAILVGICWLSYSQYITETNINQNRYYELYTFFAIFIFFLIFSALNNAEYVSDLIVFPDHIEIIYKRGIIESKRTIILKEEIESFKAVATINNKIDSKWNVEYYINTNITTTIELRNKSQIQFTLLDGQYQFILDLIRVSREIPNFEYEIKGNDLLAKKNIENYIQYGRELNTYEKILYSYNAPASFCAYFIIFLLIIIFIILFIGVYL